MSAAYMYLWILMSVRCLRSCYGSWSGSRPRVLPIHHQTFSGADEWWKMHRFGGHSVLVKAHLSFLSRRSRRPACDWTMDGRAECREAVTRQHGRLCQHILNPYASVNRLCMDFDILIRCTDMRTEMRPKNCMISNHVIHSTTTLLSSRDWQAVIGSALTMITWPQQSCYTVD